MESYHRSSQPTTRTRPQTWVPKRVWYVLNYLKRQLAPDKPKAISNKTIQEAIRFGSEGEVSQIMRWLAGELPTMGRWAYGILQSTEQRYRFIERERMSSGGYVIRLLAHPEPIAPPEPQIAQLDMFADDPSMIPPPALADAARGGSFSDMALDRAGLAHRGAAQRRSQRDHEKESLKDQQQQPARSALESNPLYQKLISDPDMSESLARRVCTHAPGSIEAFESDLAAVPSTIRMPLIWLASIWATGKRPKPRHAMPRQTPDRESEDKRPQPEYFTPRDTSNVLTAEQRREALRRIGTPEFVRQHYAS